MKPPIPDPSGALSTYETRRVSARVFRMSMMRLFILYNVMFLPVFIFVLLPDSRPNEALGSAVVGEVGGLIFAIMYAQFSKVVVDEHGIQGFDTWERKCGMSWPEIEMIKPFNIPGMPYLRVLSNKKRVLWLPLFLSDMNGFRSAVSQFGGPQNPIARYLDEH